MNKIRPSFVQDLNKLSIPVFLISLQDMCETSLHKVKLAMHWYFVKLLTDYAKKNRLNSATINL